MNSAIFSWGGDMLASLVIETNFGRTPPEHDRRNPSQLLRGSARETARIAGRASAPPVPGREKRRPVGAACGLPNRGGRWRQDKFGSCAMGSQRLAKRRFPNGLTQRE